MQKILTSPCRKRNLARLLALAVCLLAAPVAAVERVTLHALFQGKAILMIDGARRVLEVGATSPEGVRLLATDTSAERAELEIDGRRQTVQLGTVFGAFTPAKGASVTLYAEPDGHFHADGAINGAPVRFLVDTGATSIALSGQEAARIGIDYRKNGQAGYANTAGGVVRMWNVRLNRVEIGPITLYNVEAGVVEGAYPREALLGMSVLGRLDMKRDGERLELTQRY